MTTRRNFIKTGAAQLARGLLAKTPLPVVNRQAMGTTIVQKYAEDLAGNGNILLIVELAGGCDPLNTIVPLQQYDTYASLRSRIALPKDQVLPLHGTTYDGIGASLNALKPIADAGQAGGDSDGALSQSEPVARWLAHDLLSGRSERGHGAFARRLGWPPFGALRQQRQSARHGRHRRLSARRFTRRAQKWRVSTPTGRAMPRSTPSKPTRATPATATTSLPPHA
jgi:hypothetical protein